MSEIGRNSGKTRKLAVTYMYLKKCLNCQQNYENIQIRRMLSHLKSTIYNEFVIHKDLIC